MAASVTSLTGRFDPETRDQASPGRIIFLGIFGGGTSIQRQTARNEVLHRPDFIVTGRMDVAGETLTAINLTDQGVTFPAGTIRPIDVECFVTGNLGASTEMFYTRKREVIIGGTTPVLGVVIGAIDTNLAGATGDGFTTADPALDFIMSTNDVTLRLTNEGATEINNFVLKVTIGKLQPVLLGI